jgi:hypothetical protein
MRTSRSPTSFNLISLSGGLHTAQEKSVTGIGFTPMQQQNFRRRAVGINFEITRAPVISPQDDDE